MSLADKFDDHSEPAFTRNFDPESARRQLRVSLVLVVAMAFAAFVLGFALPLNAPHSSRVTPVTTDSGDFSGRLVTINER
ncbi:MAG: hypothetical protein HYS06_04785 [Methylocystis sp.]|nr:hypothetical protein [Methylocystis sp.]MBI3274820.1 hypothetical protein [Methylocystis sp.]